MWGPGFQRQEGLSHSGMVQMTEWLEPFVGLRYQFRFTQVVSESPGVGKAQQQRLEKKALVASTRSFSHQRFATSL